MALWFRAMVNDDEIAFVEIRRQETPVVSDRPMRYTVEAESGSHTTSADFLHWYRDGGLVLVLRALIALDLQITLLPPPE